MQMKTLIKRNRKRFFSAALVLTLLAGVTLEANAEDPIKSQGNFDFQDADNPSAVAKFFSADLEYLYNEVEEQIAAVTAGKGKVADAIKEKDSTASVTSASTFDELSASIKDIGKSATATAADVAGGKTFYDGTGYKTGTMTLSGTAAEANVLAGTTFYSDSLAKKTGTMENMAGLSKDVPAAATFTGDIINGTVKIPKSGYYDTTSSLTFKINTTKLVSLTGSAVPSQVLNGQTFYSNSQAKQTGSMPNKANTTQPASIAVNGNTGTVKVPAAGYYDTNAKLSVDLTANNNSYFEKGKQEGAFNEKKVILTDNAGEWYTPTGSGYEVVGNSKEYRLGSYSEVYICVEEITAGKYGSAGDGNPEVWRDSMGAYYDSSTGKIIVNYGNYLYNGGGNACKMTILYR